MESDWPTGPVESDWPTDCRVISFTQVGSMVWEYLALGIRLTINYMECFLGFIRLLDGVSCTLEISDWIGHLEKGDYECVVPGKPLKVLFHSIGRPVRLGPDAVCVWFGVWPWIPGPFSLQADPSDGRSQITLEPINGASGNDNHSLLITSKESQFTIQFLHYRLPLCPMQLHAVGRVNNVARSNKFPFPMILVWDGKAWTLLGTPWKTIWLVDESDVVLILSLGDKRSAVVLILSLGDKRSDVRESDRGQSDETFSLHFWGVRRLVIPIVGLLQKHCGVLFQLPKWIKELLEDSYRAPFVFPLSRSSQEPEAEKGSAHPRIIIQVSARVIQFLISYELHNPANHRLWFIY